MGINPCDTQVDTLSIMYQIEEIQLTQNWAKYLNLIFFILKQGITCLLNYDLQSHGLRISRVGWSKLQSKEPHMRIKPKTT
jgi:hypothetical protein